jgi:hypothetical protein
VIGISFGLEVEIEVREVVVCVWKEKKRGGGQAKFFCRERLQRR